MKIAIDGFAGEIRIIALEEIEGIKGFPLDKVLMKNIKNRELLQLPTVCERGDGKYKVIAGKRRSRAFLELKYTQIPVIVKEKATENDLDTISENHARRTNLLCELEALKDLMEVGLTEEDIREELSLYKRDLDSLFRLTNLSETALAALTEGKISGTTAQVLAKIPSAWQGEFFSTVLPAKRGKWTLDSAREFRLQKIANAKQMGFLFQKIGNL
jgi:ParB/RepB/Spo0J family partition protein